MKKHLLMISYRLYKYSSLHCAPVSSNDNHFTCTCKLFHHTGYVCSHILVAKHSCHHHPIDILQFHDSMSQNELGRKRKRSSVLKKDNIQKKDPGTYLNQTIIHKEMESYIQSKRQ